MPKGVYERNRVEPAMMKCATCQIVQPKENFRYREFKQFRKMLNDFKRYRYRRVYCKSCQGKEVAEYQKKHPKKHYARTQVHLAVKKGTLIKLSCKICGEDKSEGHHPDYDKPLKVVWLCRKHHWELHKAQLLKKYAAQEQNRGRDNICISP